MSKFPFIILGSTTIALGIALGATFAWEHKDALPNFLRLFLWIAGFGAAFFAAVVFGIVVGSGTIK